MRVSQPKAPQRRAALVVPLAALALLCLASVPSRADSTAAPRDSVAVEKRASSNTAPAENFGRKQRQRNVAVALVMLVGIMFVGLALIALTILWGFRVRRIARAPLPKRKPVDPLWYLRPEKNRSQTDSAGPGTRPSHDETEPP